MRAGDQEMRSRDQEMRARDQEMRAEDQEMRARDQEMRAGDQEMTARDQEMRTGDQEMRAGARIVVNLKILPESREDDCILDPGDEHEGVDQTQGQLPPVNCSSEQTEHCTVCVH